MAENIKRSTVDNLLTPGTKNTLGKCFIRSAGEAAYKWEQRLSDLSNYGRRKDTVEGVDYSVSGSLDVIYAAVNASRLNENGDAVGSENYSKQLDDPTRSNFTIKDPKKASYVDSNGATKVSRIEVIDGSTTKLVLEDGREVYNKMAGVAAPVSAYGGNQADAGAGNAAAVYYNAMNYALDNDGQVVFTEKGQSVSTNYNDQTYTNGTTNLILADGRKVPMDVVGLGANQYSMSDGSVGADTA